MKTEHHRYFAANTYQHNGKQQHNAPNSHNTAYDNKQEPKNGDRLIQAWNDVRGNCRQRTTIRVVAPIKPEEIAVSPMTSAPTILTAWPRGFGSRSPASRMIS